MKRVIVTLLVLLASSSVYAGTKGQQIEQLATGIAAAQNGTVYIYDAGTNNLADVWNDRDKLSDASNPVDLDSNGAVLIFADGSVKLDVRDSDGNTVDGYPQDGLGYIYPASALSVTDQLSAADSSGLKLLDDSDTQGIFIKDGGFVAIHDDTNPLSALAVANAGTKTYATTLSVTTNDSDVFRVRNTSASGDFVSIQMEAGTDEGIARIIAEKAATDETDFYIHLRDASDASNTEQQLKLTSEGELTIGGDLIISGTISGVTGADFSGTITVDALDVTGNVNVSGNTVLTGTLRTDGAVDFNSTLDVASTITAATNETINGIDINSGAVSDVTTLTATNIAAHNLTGKLTAGATEIEGSGFDIDGGDVSAITVSGGLTWSAAQNFGSQVLTNVNIDSGSIDGTPIGSASASSVAATTITANTISTGQGQYEVFAMNQDVKTTDAVTFITVDTGQGANELYDMDQNVLISSTVQFASITDGTITITGGNLTGATGVTATNLTGTLQTAAQGNVTSIGTLTSLAISGDLTVDTNTLYVDSTNNRVGIGTDNPQSLLHLVSSGAGLQLRLENSLGNIIGGLAETANNDGVLTVRDSTGAIQSQITADTGDNSYFLGNVGIGTSGLGAKLQVKGDSLTSEDLLLISDSGGANLMKFSSDASGHGNLFVRDTAGTSKILLNGGGDSYFNGGNVGIGTSSPTRELSVSGDIKAETLTLTTQPRVYLTHDAQRTISTQLVPTWNTELYDIGSMHDTGSNTERITIGEDGTYTVSVSLNLNDSGVADLSDGDWFELVLQRFNSGASLQNAWSVSESLGAEELVFMAITQTIYCSSGDYFRIIINEESSDTVKVNATASDWPLSFSAHKIH